MWRGVTARRTITLAVGCLLFGFQASAYATAHAAVEDPVEIGPGSRGRPPGSRIIGQRPGREPAWVANVPEVAEPAPVDAATDGRALAVGALATIASSASQGSESGLPKPGTYDGTVTIDVAYYNYCTTGDGNLAYAGSRKYRMGAQLIVGAPAEYEGVRERSPFNLIGGSAFGVEASTQIASATVATDVRDGESIVADYWDIDQQGRQMRGVLTNRLPGLNLNSMQTARPLGDPCQAQSPTLAMMIPIAEGAKLSGTVADTSIKLDLLGQTIDRERRFRASFDVKRVR